MGSVQRNGQPESEATEATPSGTGHEEAAAQSPDGAVPHEAGFGAGRSAGDPAATDPSDRGSDAGAAATPASAAPPQTPAGYATAAPYSAGADGAAVVPPPGWNDAAAAGAPSDGASLSGAAVPPVLPSSGHTAQFPAAAGAVPPPPAWYPGGPGTAPYAAGPAPYPPSPYPPGQYPPAGPYAAAPPTEPPTRRRAAWAAPSPGRTHRWGLGAYLLAEAVFLGVSAVIGVFVISDAQPTASMLAVALAVPTMLAAATALLITWVRGNGPRTDLGLEWSWRDVGLGLAFGFGGLALTIPASIVYVAIVGEDATSAVGDVFGGIRAGPALAALVLVIVVLVAPFCEEILYRGLLWGGIEKLAGRWTAFVVTTLLFALAHFEFTRTPLLLVVAIPIAIARLYTGRLVASIVAHQINNLLPGIVLVLGLLGVVPMG